MPKGGKGCVESQPPQSHTQNQPQSVEAAEQTPCRIESEGGHSHKQAQAGQKIRQPKKPFSPKRTEKVVQKPQKDTQKGSDQQLGSLRANRQLHQPNSRARKPTASRPSSS